MLPIAVKIRKFELPAPAFWAGWAFAAGIFVAPLTNHNLFFWLVACAGFGLFAGFFHLWSQKAFANFSFLVLFIGLGALRYSAVADGAAGRSVENFAGLGRRLFISGRVRELPEIKADRTRMYLDKIELGWKPKVQLEGKILLSIGQPVASFGLGDQIEFTGFLDSLWHPANPGSLDFARYMRIRGVEGTVFLKDSKGISIAAKNSGGVRSRLAKARDFVEQKLTQGLPPKAAGVIKGFVLGDTRDIESSTYELFRKTGTLHLLAVSGANVAWVALLPILLLKLFYISLHWRYLAALVLVWVFVLLTDLQASVLRAAIMFTFWTTSKIIYREVSGLQSLGLSLLFLLSINPLWFFDLGFQLSYLAAFALIFFSFRELASFDRRFLWRRFMSVVTTPLVAFLATFPLLAFYFNQMTPVSLLSNLLAVPMALLITWSSFLFGFLNLFGAGLWMADGVAFLFDTLFRIQGLFVGHPFFHFVIPHPDGWTTFLLFLTAFAMLVFLFRAEWRKPGAYLLLSGLIPLVWLPELKKKPDFALSVLEARGEIVSVLSLPGQTIVIGGGEAKADLLRRVLEPFLAYLGKEKIEGYLPFRLDSSARVASDDIAKKFRPDFIGRPVAGITNENSAAPADAKFEYLLASGDSVPFGLRLVWNQTAFLFIPQLKRSRLLRWDLLLSGPSVLVAPLQIIQAESLAGLVNVHAVVSTQRAYRLPQKLPKEVFFIFRDGAITFRTKEEGLAVQAHLSKRKLVFNHR